MAYTLTRIGGSSEYSDCISNFASIILHSEDSQLPQRSTLIS